MRLRCVEVLLFSVLLACSACSPPTLPTGVAADSAWVESVKGGYWQRCEVSSPDGVRCTIWNAKGIVLVDEAFRPIDGGPLPTAAMLAHLRTGGPCTGAYQVCLSDGRILLPISRYDEMKAFIKGRRRQP